MANLRRKEAVMKPSPFKCMRDVLGLLVLTPVIGPPGVASLITLAASPADPVQHEATEPYRWSRDARSGAFVHYANIGEIRRRPATREEALALDDPTDVALSVREIFSRAEKGQDQRQPRRIEHAKRGEPGADNQGRPALKRRDPQPVIA